MPNQPKICRRFVFVVIWLGIILNAFHVMPAQEKTWYEQRSEWNGYPQFHFKVSGRSAYLVTPKTTAAGNPWVWRARFPNYHAEMDIRLLAKGYHIAYIDVAGMFGNPKAIKIGDAFYDFVTTRRRLARKPALEGVSRGGLFVYNWAANHPGRVACIYCDTPVCDIKSWPGGKGTGIGSETTWLKCLREYGLTEERAIQFKKNPIDHAKIIAEAKIPILHIVSENDRIVPANENTYVLKNRLAKRGHSLEVISVREGTKKSNGHHFDHPAVDRVVDFIVKHTSRRESKSAKAIRIACLGDSITAGARVDPKTKSYPAQLQKILGASYDVKNFGAGGATLIRSGRPSVWQKLGQVKEFQPQIVVISLGTNDTVGGKRRNWERIGKFEEDYDALINELHGLKSSPQIVICTPTSMVLKTEKLSPARLKNLQERQPRLKELCQQIRKIVKDQDSNNVSLLELNDVLEDRPQWLTQGDGVHPNEQGYLAIAKKVAQHLLRQSSDENKKRPNIVLFLVDDMGWQDTSVPFDSKVSEFNKRYRTPNMQRLAEAGMKFTQAYACSVCSPTRVSLMTGLNAARHRVTNWTLRKNASNDRKHSTLDFPKWNVNGLSPQAGVERTVHAKALPAFLQQSGYHTIHVGKAHFGAIGTPGSDPTNLGFDVNIAGHAAGGPGSFLGTQNFSAAWRNGDRVWDVPDLKKYHGQDVFLTEALTIEANRAVDKAVAAGQPFFLYMSHYTVHAPFAADQRFYQKYRDSGLDHTEAMYAAMVEGMDNSLGDIVANLNRHQIADDTIVLFMSDNGGLSAQGRGGKRHAHNFPLSSGKGSAHEGGVRVPMIAYVPGITQAGSTCGQPVMIEDFFPSILELADVQPANQLGGVIDGISFVSLLKGEQDKSREKRPLIWHYPNHWGPKGPGIGPSSSIRRGDWKLIYYHQDQSFELFNIAKDIGEQNNLADGETEIRDRMASQLGQFLKSTDAQMPTIRSTGEPVPYPDAAPTEF